MDIRTSLAAQNYAKARSAAAPSPGESGDGFAQLATSFAETLKQSETISRAAMTGGADPHALVQALAQSQLAVETVTAVRDKVVEAYQEILRMPV
jgi:flagellar hook-basal body complex protein FliE